MLDRQIIDKKNEYEKMSERLCARARKISNLRLALFLAFLCTAVFAWKMEPYRPLFFSIGGLLLVVFVIVAAWHTLVIEEEERLKRSLQIIGQYECRDNGRWRRFPENGSEFITEENEDVIDLNLLGKNSVFQFLNIAYSYNGRKKLKKALLHPSYDKDELRYNQDAVKEMKDNFSFALDFQERRSHTEAQPNAEKDEEKGAQPEKPSKGAGAFAGGVVLSAGTIFVLLSACFGLVGFNWFAYLFIVSLAYNHLYLLMRKKEFAEAVSFSKRYGRYEGICDLVKSENFESDKLKVIQKNVTAGREIMKRISRLAALCKGKENWLSYLIFNPLFSLNTMILFWYRRIFNTQHELLQKSLLALDELECTIALTGVAWVKKDICMPELTDDISLQIGQVCHPLLEEKNCVANDINCEDSILIITGSNMSGKTSFMRTVGINLTLMYAGTYVNAKEFQAPFMRIASSIGVQDDISRGISTFCGELLRMKKIFETAEKSAVPVIVFIDEIFKGTNYNDRIFGAKAIVGRLSKTDGIAMITTHDFELCDIKDKRIQNYHFAETYEGEKIVFDYKIREGRCTTTNARYLMGEMGLLDGLPDEEGTCQTEVD